jgi:hypothetical protein
VGRDAHRFSSMIFACAGVCASAVAAACSARPSTPAFAIDGGDGDAAADGGRPGAGEAGAGPGDSGVAPPPTQDASLDAAGPAALLRVANWSPDAPAAGYDVCLAPSGTSAWQGPEVATALGSVGSLGDAGVSAVQFPVVTNYLLFVGPGTYDVEVVAPGEGCGHPLAVSTGLLPLATGVFYTLAIVGDTAPAGGDPPLAAILLGDDSAAAGGAASLRFLDVAPSVRAADFGEGTVASGTFVALATAAAFGALPGGAGPDAGALDPNGYASIPATGTSVTLSAHAAPASGDAQAAVDLATASALTPMPGDVDTIALVGGKTGGGGPRLLVCTGDGVQNQSTGLVSSCTPASM